MTSMSSLRPLGVQIIQRIVPSSSRLITDTFRHLPCRYRLCPDRRHPALRGERELCNHDIAAYGALSVGDAGMAGACAGLWCIEPYVAFLVAAIDSRPDVTMPKSNAVLQQAPQSWPIRRSDVTPDAPVCRCNHQCFWNRDAKRIVSRFWRRGRDPPPEPRNRTKTAAYATNIGRFCITVLHHRSRPKSRTGSTNLGPAFKDQTCLS